MRRLLWILLALSTIVLLVFVLRQTGSVELAYAGGSPLETRIIVLALGVVIALAVFRQRLTHALEAALIWTVVGTLLLGLFGVGWLLYLLFPDDTLVANGAEPEHKLGQQRNEGR